MPAAAAAAHDTVAACATAWGHAAIAVVRVTGPGAVAAAEAVVGRLGPPRMATWRRFSDAAGSFDDGLVTTFPGPRSYTGEDLVELSGHGNPLLVERLLRALAVRPARPGEFTRRAFLSGRLDLTRCEAVLAMLEATSARGLAHARAALDGVVATEAEALSAAVTDVAAELEAALDYPGEDLLFATDDAVAGRLRDFAARAEELAASFPAGARAVQGARVVLAGPVNAGKSSLFNALLGQERAIVSPRPGTTRDAVEAVLQLPEVRITLVDTAGDRATDDEVEALGVARGAAERAGADLVVWCVPPGGAAPPGGVGQIVVGTLADVGPSPLEIQVSSKTGAGVEALRGVIVRALLGEPGAATAVVTSARQADLFRQTGARLVEAAGALHGAGPAVAVELLYAALEALAEVGGGAVRESVLDRMFARFCIGK